MYHVFYIYIHINLCSGLHCCLRRHICTSYGVFNTVYVHTVCHIWTHYVWFFFTFHSSGFTVHLCNCCKPVLSKAPFYFLAHQGPKRSGTQVFLSDGYAIGGSSPSLPGLPPPPAPGGLDIRGGRVPHSLHQDYMNNLFH